MALVASIVLEKLLAFLSVARRRRSLRRQHRSHRNED
jgi:hypothetical protein